MFDWALCENEDEVIEVLIDGLAYLSRDSRLIFASSIIYEDGFEIKEVADKMMEIDGVTFTIPDSSDNDFEQDKDFDDRD